MATMFNFVSKELGRMAKQKKTNKKSKHYINSRARAFMPEMREKAVTKFSNLMASKDSEEFE